VSTISQISLNEIANRLKLELHGDADVMLSGVASLKKAKKNHLVFIEDEKHLKDLKDSAAGAVILSKSLYQPMDIPLLISEHPYLDFIKSSKLFSLSLEIFKFSNNEASQTVRFTGSMRIHPTTLIGNDTVIGNESTIHAGTVIGQNVSIGRNVTIHPNVTIYDSVDIGDYCVIQSGSVIGSQGFGYLETKEGWYEVPHFGGVRIGRNVMVGANCSIDRGTLDDTIICDGVKLDNIIHIAHNVKIGSGTAIAAMTGIAGSTIIGKDCKIAGRVSIVGHLIIGDGVTITSNSLITKSILDSRSYSGGVPSEESKAWRRVVGRLKKGTKIGP
jgi:UDP-3-O-[3-hydroxymyristoyl] glucosamine N-acyltransferase